ncbi:MAG: DUF924 family protein [Alphaproteobacteria bacterium]
MAVATEQGDPMGLFETGDTARSVLAFWFEETAPRTWFNATPAFDAAVGERFGALVDRALAGELADWRDNRPGALALLLLLDQFTRNMFRGTPRAFAGDGRALVVARRAIGDGFDLEEEDPDRRQFFYSPYTHQEDLAAQEEGVRLTEARLAGHSAARYARLHRDVIAEFGRFPHRNAILGRETTSGEQAYLEAGGGFR